MSDEDIALSADSAETDPGFDLLNFSTLAKGIANGIDKLTPSDGITMAITGGWGTGKSTMINFIKYYLREMKSPIQIIDFNPWWFSGHEDLVRKLFQQLAHTVNHSSQAEKKFGELLHDLAEVVDTVPVEFKPSLWGFSVDLKKVASLSAAKLRSSKSVPQIKQEIAETICDANLRYLIAIDDVDRLSVDEIRDLFRAVKAIGDLPNIIYLIALDRDVVAKSLDDCFPGRGAAYLDKILQVSFDLPMITDDNLSKVFINKLNHLLKGLQNTVIDEERLGLLYRLGISKLLSTPRHSVRFINSLSVTLTSVNGEVNIADFIALESLRLFLPEIYTIIRSNKEMFCGVLSREEGDWRKESLKSFHSNWMDSRSLVDRIWLKKFLSELFPILNIAWDTRRADGDSDASYRRQMRICSKEIFDCYFIFGVPQGIVSGRFLQTFIETANNGSAKDLISQTIGNNEKFYSLIERLDDHVIDSLSPGACYHLFSDFVSIWDLCVDSLQNNQNYNLFDNTIVLLRLLLKLLKKCEYEDRIRLIQMSIKKHSHPDVIRRILLNLEKVDEVISERPADEYSVCVLAADYSMLASNLCEEIHSHIAIGEISDGLVIGRLIDFVLEVSIEKARVIISAIQDADLRLISTIAIRVKNNKIISPASARGEQFIVNLSAIARIIDPNDLVADVQKLLNQGCVDERSRLIAKNFLDQMAVGGFSG